MNNPIYFDEVLKLVNDGYTIRQALSKVQVNTSWFYKNITPIQKQKLWIAKSLNNKH